jgi:hypothetical protein
MDDIEELYDSKHPAEDCEISIEEETLTTVDPVSRLHPEVGSYDTTDDVISVRIDTS